MEGIWTCGFWRDDVTVSLSVKANFQDKITEDWFKKRLTFDHLLTSFYLVRCSRRILDEVLVDQTRVGKGFLKIYKTAICNL